MLMAVGFRALARLDLRGPCRAALARLAAMRDAAEGRRLLARMDDRLLADIGLSRAEAAREIARRPWDTKPGLD